MLSTGRPLEEPNRKRCLYFFGDLPNCISLFHSNYFIGVQALSLNRLGTCIITRRHSSYLKRKYQFWNHRGCGNHFTARRAIAWDDWFPGTKPEFDSWGML